MTEELQTLALFHALDLLDEEERRLFQAKAEQDVAVQARASELREVAGALALAPPAQVPPASLRARLLSKINIPDADDSSATVELADGLSVVFVERLDWHETGVPGVRVKPLHIDEDRRYASNLVSMEAGAVYPRHWHADLEELFMLTGEITVSGLRLHAGDYCRAAPGSVHDDVTAESDCTFIALASLRNEFRSKEESA